MKVNWSQTVLINLILLCISQNQKIRMDLSKIYKYISFFVLITPKNHSTKAIMKFMLIFWNQSVVISNKDTSNGPNLQESSKYGLIQRFWTFFLESWLLSMKEIKIFMRIITFWWNKYWKSVRPIMLINKGKEKERREKLKSQSQKITENRSPTMQTKETNLSKAFYLKNHLQTICQGWGKNQQAMLRIWMEMILLLITIGIWDDQTND